MDKRIENSIDENTNLSEEFREMAKNCFGRIFDMLGKRNFERWIDKRELSDRIKQLIIESMSSEETKKYPNYAGYYTRGENKIKLKLYKNSKDTEDTATHEKMHFITDHGSQFPPFMDEGLTEYMKGMAEGRPKTYTENVATIEFLHKVFGDSLIKAYLMGKPREFDKKINLLITGRRLSTEGKKEITEFYDNLQTFQEYSYFRGQYLSANSEENRRKYTEEELDDMKWHADNAEREFDAVRGNITGMLQKILVAKISDMSKNLEFYRNGILDLEFASQTIADYLRILPIQHFEKDYMNVHLLKSQTMQLALREVIANSHLVAYDEGTAREEKIDMLVGKLVPIVEVKGRQITRRPRNIDNNDPLFAKENEDMISKLLYITVPDSESSITRYLEKIALIQGKFNISDAKMKYILTRQNADRFRTSTGFNAINGAILSAFPMFRKLFELEREREKDTIESFYSEIDSNRFIEKRDNQKFFIEFDPNGEISQQELHWGNNVVFSQGRRLEINYKKGFNNFEVSDETGTKKIVNAPISLQSLKELKYSEEITRNIFGKIRKGEYTTILNDFPDPYKIEGVRYTSEIDRRTRKIDWNGFIQDVININRALPNNSIGADAKQRLIESLLDSTYGFYPRRDDRGILARSNDIDKIYQGIFTELDRILYTKVYSARYEQIIQKIMTLSDKLDGARKERIAESSKTALIDFKSPEAKKEYFDLLAKENQEKTDNAVREFDYKKYIEIAADTDNPQLRLSGVYTTSDIDTRDRKLLVKEFAEATRNLMEIVPEEQRKDVFDTVFSQMIQKAYGISQRDLQSDKRLQSDFGSVKTAVSNNVFLGKDLEENSLSGALENMNKYHKQVAENNKRVAAIAFNDEGTKKMYDVIVALTKEQVSFDDMQKQVRTLIEIHNDQTKNASSKNKRNDGDLSPEEK